MPYTLCTGPLLLANRLRMEALVKRGVRSGLCAADTPNWTELSESSDDAPFNRVLCNQDHILFPLLPDKRHFTYNLRKRNHNRLLTIKQGRLCSCNFITRMLFKACYWLCSTSFYSRYFSRIYMYYCVIVAFCQHVLNEHAMLCFNDNFFYIFLPASVHRRNRWLVLIEPRHVPGNPGWKPLLCTVYRPCWILWWFAVVKVFAVGGGCSYIFCLIVQRLNGTVGVNTVLR